MGFAHTHWWAFKFYSSTALENHEKIFSYIKKNVQLLHCCCSSYRGPTILHILASSLCCKQALERSCGSYQWDALLLEFGGHLPLFSTCHSFLKKTYKQPFPSLMKVYRKVPPKHHLWLWKIPLNEWVNHRNYFLNCHLPLQEHPWYTITTVAMYPTLEMSGSEAMKLQNLAMAHGPSSIPSSILISKICAPISTWALATPSASYRGIKNIYNFFKSTKRLNLQNSLYSPLSSSGIVNEQQWTDLSL